MEGNRRHLGTAAVIIGKILFPHFCCGCGREGAVLCGECKEADPPSEGIFVCPGCGAATPLGARCGRRKCAASALDGLAAMAPYGRPVPRALLGLYKYERVEEAGAALERMFGRFAERHSAAMRSFVGAAKVAPVPLPFFRQAARGFNQSERFAAALAAAAGARLAAAPLRRRFRWEAQAMLEEEDRRSNARGSVAARVEPRDGAAAKKAGDYVLVDDVVTTGATLEACAAALKKAGAASVKAVAVLKG